jgi:hypothetical protein
MGLQIPPYDSHVVCRVIYISLCAFDEMVEHGIVPKSIKASFMREEHEV